MVEMTPQRWEQTNRYLAEVFGSEDAAIAQIATDSRAAGLPDIAVDAVVGRMLMMLASMTRGRLAIEVGTLGGYSASWIQRGLAATGKLITIEIEPKHAEFARGQFERLGVADRVQVRLGDAAEVLLALAGELEAGSVDFVFLDADKVQYPAYWQTVRPLIGVGGLVVMDNALGSGEWWVGDDQPSRHGADSACRLIAKDPDFEAVAFPLRQGVLVGRRMRIT